MRHVTTDVVVVGSGAAGLLATAQARRHGLAAILVESTELIGGSSAMSGGALWLPNNPLMEALGETDSFAQARDYLDACLGAERPASTRARRDAYLETAPELVPALQHLGLRLEAAAGYPDYYPERPGGKTQGRSVECQVTDAARLGEWRERCRFTIPVALKGSEAPRFATSLTTFKGFLTAADVIGRRSVWGRIRGRHYVSGGAALVTGLLLNVLESGAGVWVDSQLRRILTDGGRATGVVVGRGASEIQIEASHGVVLACGGFEHNEELRERYLPQPTDERWSSGNPGNLGTALDMGVELGAALDLLDDAWWGPTFLDEQRHPQFALWERTLPHSIIVDATGNRYFNEAEPYSDAGHHMYARNDAQRGTAVPSWLIMDNRHRSRYPLGRWLPGAAPRAALKAGVLVKAKSLQALAKTCGIDEAGLISTVARFNGFAKRGKDADFGRGDSAYDRYYGDPHHKPNPTLGALERGPFWAVRMVPGDLGTKGGLVTDADARVLRTDGSVIDGLYAAGNATASVMARSYPGAGGTLGPALVFAYRAVEHLAGASRTDR